MLLPSSLPRPWNAGSPGRGGVLPGAEATVATATPLYWAQRIPRVLGLQAAAWPGGSTSSMDSLYVEEVAASLVREFLSRKGLKKTFVTMDQERPRCELSINSRNDLRKVLHLEFLYRENKAKEKPLKTNLELITRYFLDHSGNTDDLSQETLIPALPVPKTNNKLPSSCLETTLVNIYDLSDEDTGRRTSWSEAGKARHDNFDGDTLGNFISPKKSPYKSKPVHTVAGDSLPLVPAWEKVEQLHSSEPCIDVKRPVERTRPKSGLIVRGMMAGPVASSPQDSFRKRSLRRSSSLSRKLQAPEECQQPSESLVQTPACPGPQEVPSSSSDSVSRSPLGQLNELPMEKPNASPSSQGPSQRDRARLRRVSEDGLLGSSHTETSTTSLKLYLPGGNSRVTQERPERAFKRQGSQPPSLRKNQLVSDKASDKPDALWLATPWLCFLPEDVEDELIKEDIVLSPLPSMPKLQAVSKPIDLSLAKEMKTLLFGSTFCCFSEEWKLQNFSFSDTASLKYGIVQNKGGPCGVLAAVQGCVLKKLLFDEGSRTNSNLVRQDFDVPTSHLIGAHGYCTQELVNLLLTGRAVSNVFNDVVELDSGDGNTMLLRGIKARSDIGFLSLFEHYNVCQVGCFLKTPRFPIWVVCSESHFSILFSLQPELLSDWRTERLFDLYYYDGLANQQEEIRLTVDTTKTSPEDSCRDLVPPLELCIRTKWKGASVNWNGSDPIL
ncbi:probable ubiquitin carboxyl-terminal hydrolase MINDY-4 isoform X6 [Cricetulus griseus]|uniref:Ubiquitin carboxyl-terminal hydrolase MINDY n=1 Tax=Cricetulus griseus TaxID=10029 RepID=A0A9J7KAR2_CRIGR|nr:probable ubiquitin carboxyl-terminal hydrolase MINDY-4 isoform X6 [Cricetulus griseus]XP_035312720.1 probable ubiquitin carboxyl-terminal hydrolase MINDY-4 isoform X6 [Cricetulus griseus]